MDFITLLGVCFFTSVITSAGVVALIHGIKGLISRSRQSTFKDNDPEADVEDGDKLSPDKWCCNGNGNGNGKDDKK